MDFIPTTIPDTDAPGIDAENDVMERLKDAFGPGDKGVIYYRFPIKDRAGERFDKEPDFVILDEKNGLTVVEVKGYTIKQIEKIEGQVWSLNNCSQDTSRPYSQAREQAFFIQSYFLKEPALRDDSGNVQVPLNFVVALPNISKDEWREHGFEDTPSVRVLTSDDLTPQSLRESLDDLPSDTMGSEYFDAARSALGGGEVISGKRGQPNPDPTTKSEFYEKVETGLNELDKDQEEIGLQIPPGPQQIRGIAGSGKTILLAMKAAAMHAHNPDWKIALTFNTRSLYETIRSDVSRFAVHFSDSEMDEERLDILHGWGGSTEHGLYYKIAQSAGFPPNNVRDAQNKFGYGSPSELLSASCEELIESANIQQEYDAILIDEAQDMESAFFQMCYKALKEPKRLIWAYDEAQDLTSLEPPTPKKIFEEGGRIEETIDMSGSYKGGIQRSQIMGRSYRAPREILMTAHVLGMGLKRPEGAVQAITQKEHWEDIGYSIEAGNFVTPGEPVTLNRPKENSPHPLTDEDLAKPFVRFNKFEDRDTELEFVCDAISRDIHDEGLDPEQILVICLGSPKKGKEIGENVSNILREKSIEGNRVWEGNSSIFAKEGEVTISRVNRAKGNEAAQVYILGVDETAKSNWHDTVQKARNELFVAITRSRAWCHITGTGSDLPLFNEINEVIDDITSHNATITFPAPDKQKQGSYSDDTMATTLSQFDEIDREDLSSETVDCPVNNCNFSATPGTIARHVSGTNDINHSWKQIGFDDASEFIDQYRE